MVLPNRTSSEAKAIRAALQDKFDRLFKGKGGNASRLNRMDTIDKLYAGEHWGTNTPNQTEYQCVVNKIFEAVEAYFALCMDFNIKPKIIPRQSKVYVDVPQRNPDTGEPVINPETQKPVTVKTPVDVTKRAPFIQRAFDFFWKESNLPKAKSDTIHDAGKYGTGLTKLYFDPSKHRGQGRICGTRVSRKNVVPGDIGIDTVSDQDVMFEITYLSFAQIVNRYEDLTEDEKRKLHGMKGTLLQYPYMDRPDQSISLAEGAGRQVKLQDTEDTDLIPVTIAQVKYHDDITYGNNDIKTTESLNNMFFIFADDVILEISPFYDHGDFIYTKLDDYSQPGRFDGIGEADVAEPFNADINNMWSLILANIEKLGSGKILAEEGVILDQWTSEVGPIIKVKKGALSRNEIQILSGLSVPGDHFAYVQAKTAEWEAVSGISRTLMGRPPGSGVESGKAIDSLIQAASQRFVPRLRNIQEYVKNLATQFLHLMLQYYDGRFFKVMGPEGAQAMMQFKRMYEENGHWYEIEIEGANALPISRADRAQVIHQLFNTPIDHEGMVPLSTLVNAYDIPLPEDIEEKNTQKKVELRQQQIDAQKQIMEAQAEAQNRGNVNNMRASLGNDNPEIVQEGLDKLGLGG